MRNRANLRGRKGQGGMGGSEGVTHEGDVEGDDTPLTNGLWESGPELPPHHARLHLVDHRRLLGLAIHGRVQHCIRAHHRTGHGMKKRAPGDT